MSPYRCERPGANHGPRRYEPGAFLCAAISEPAVNFANAFANAPAGTRQDRVRRQLGNSFRTFRTWVRKRI